MTSQQAKQVLSAYRPWAADAKDPEFAEALARARQDAELGRWFEEHCAVQSALRDRFRQIPVPAGLKDQIVSEHHARSGVVWWRKPVSPMLAVAAVFLAVIGIATLWLRPSRPADEVNVATFRSRMEGQALRNYTMTLETNDLKEIRADLMRQQAPADFVLPETLAQTPLAGCGVLRWQDQRVAMICFRTGKPLPPGGKSDLFLFVVDRSALPDAPTTTNPEFNAGRKLFTATWTVGNQTYVLATEGDADFIRRYL